MITADEARAMAGIDLASKLTPSHDITKTMKGVEEAIKQAALLKETAIAVHILRRDYNDAKYLLRANGFDVEPHGMSSSFNVIVRIGW